MGTLLVTKLATPTPGPHVLQRPRLLTALDHAAGGRVVALTTFPGAGKTTLVAQWLRSRHHPSVWLTLDATDNLPAEIERYLAAALNAPDPAAALAGRRDPLWLVLDGLEAIQSAAAQAWLGEVIAGASARVHVIILSRTRAALGNAVLTAFPPLALNFTPDETTQYVEQALHGLLPSGTLARLAESIQQQTEGWCAGVRMGVEELRHSDEERLHTVLANPLAPSQRNLDDYLWQEAILPQAPALQRFMLQSSVLRDLTVDLCEAVIGVTDGISSADLLRMAAEAQLLLPTLGSPTDSATDTAATRYRHFPQLAGALRGRLHRDLPALEHALHARAAAWYEAHHDPQSAIDHWLYTPDLARAVPLIEAHAGQLLDKRDYDTIRRWLAALPDAVIAAYPLLAVMQAGVLALAGDLGQMERIQRGIDQARHTIPPSGTQDALHALSALLQDNTYTALELLTSVDAPPALAVRLLLNYGHTALLDGDLRQAEAQLRQAVEAARIISDKASLAIASVQLGQVFTLRGRLREAEAAYYAAIYQGKTHAPALLLALAHLGLAGLYREWNQLDLAAAHIRRCFQTPNLRDELQIAASVTFSAILATKRDWMGAAAALRGAESAHQHLSQSNPTPRHAILLSTITAQRLALSVAEGDTALVQRWLYRCGLAITDPIAPAQWHDYRLLAWALIQTGKYGEAAEVTARLSELCAALGWGYRQTEALVLRAAALEGSGQSATALATLAEALALAELGELLRTFVDVFSEVEHPVQRLLRTLRQQRIRQPSQWASIGEGYVNRLLGVFEPGTHRPPNPAAVSMIEPLSARELEIVRLLALGYSNQKIAGRLLIAESTVKRHINNIYGKLQVNSRTQALRRAEELGLLG
jgi:LuxR family maltose regulon positive regulatory protein